MSTISRPPAIVSSIAISSASRTRCALRHDRAEERDLDVVHMRRDVGRGNRQRRGQDARGIMMLGDADPVEPLRLDILLRATMPRKAHKLSAGRHAACAFSQAADVPAYA